MEPEDVELWSLDRTRNRFRVYALSEGRTLFGETYLRVVWGRLGSPLRERTETFAARAALEERRAELVAVRRRHGYFVPSSLGPARHQLLEQSVCDARRRRPKAQRVCAGQARLPFEAV